MVVQHKPACVAQTPLNHPKNPRKPQNFLANPENTEKSNEDAKLAYCTIKTKSLGSPKQSTRGLMSKWPEYLGKPQNFFDNVYMRGRENHRSDRSYLLDDPFDDSWGWGGGANDQDFLGFCDYPSPGSAFCSEVPSLPFHRVLPANPTFPESSTAPASGSALRPSAPRFDEARSPLAEGSRISRPKGHDLIENDNFVSPRAGVQVAARSSCHRQRAWRDGVPPPSQTLPLFTLSHLVCEGPRGGKKRPKACGLPFKHTRISHGNALFDGLFGLGVFRYCLLGIGLPQDIVFGSGCFPRSCGSQPCRSGSLSRSRGIELRSQSQINASEWECTGRTEGRGGIKSPEKPIKWRDSYPPMPDQRF